MSERIHTRRTERRRGFQPPWYTVLVYTCPDTGRVAAILRVSWHGPTPRGAFVGDCGHTILI